MTGIRAGLCSVTFRALPPERIVALAAAAGLDVIEWGGDVHVPPGDVARAAEIARMTTDAGLAVASYGSYFRAGTEESLTAVLDSAAALGADRVRVWAGAHGSAEVSEEERARVVARLRAAAIEAAARGIGLALEFHGGTLADTAPATRQVLREVDHPALSTYWQPTVGAAVPAALDEFRQLGPHVSAAHVFSWWPRTERHPLRSRSALWTRFLAEAAAAPHPLRDALLEFVPDDAPELLAGEAAALLGFLGRRP
ncbi:sugar phosphate isomerase/epimerase family protein [Zhihengliuella sp. ISTPL4]|uniref:sugar phosphate isomerase/epimerase family protein n=1 Tax=Zhihengliuella sp. ISTPL4 TaxID=2058657 RepID=UPI000C7AF9CE|nr:TIM barrel protein [Zhihengliuella sp. ISTPL4]